jgi:type I restriction enzyme S subunit
VTWTETRLKHLCVDAGQYGLNVSANDYASTGRRLIRTSDIDEMGRLRNRESAVFVDVTLEARHELHAGDLLLSRSGTIGRAILLREIEEPSTYAGYLVRFRPLLTTEPRFLAYVAASRGFQAAIEADAVTSTIQNFNAERYANIRVLAPPLDEQRRIADFLDAETTRIDELVRLRNLQIEKLAYALRSEAGGVAPQWQPLPLRRIVEAVRTGTTPTEILLPADPDNVPWYTPAALGGNLDLDRADKSVSKEDFGIVPRFSTGSILIVGIGESLGKVADLDHEATGNQQLTSIRISASADRRFVLWRLFSAYEEIRAWAQYSRVRILNNEVLKSFKVPLPSLKEQVIAREALDHRLAEFTKFRDAATRFSRLANERRQALITAAVTGGITV